MRDFKNYFTALPLNLNLIIFHFFFFFSLFASFYVSLMFLWNFKFSLLSVAIINYHLSVFTFWIYYNHAKTLRQKLSFSCEFLPSTNLYSSFLNMHKIDNRLPQHPLKSTPPFAVMLGRSYCLLWNELHFSPSLSSITPSHIIIVSILLFPI